MDAGRESDAAVAKVMGHRAWQERPDADYDTWASAPTAPGTVEEWDKQPLAAYTTDIAAAWQVVEHMNRLTPDEFELMAELGGYTACFVQGESRWGKTAPLAICRAALAAVGVEASV